MDHNFTGTDKAAKIAAATDNRHKIAEILSITRLFGMDVIPKSETCAADLEVEETGTTFEENSRIKAEAVMKATGMAAIADDSGLVVDALGGAPGVYSARFSGENATDEKNNEKLLTLMEDVPDENRRAKFVSVITMMYPDGSVLTARGECPGRIVRVPAGTNGFGYDPLFLPDGYSVTYAQLTAEEKNSISHRAKALESLRQQLLSAGNASAAAPAATSATSGERPAETTAAADLEKKTSETGKEKTDRRPVAEE